jgi:hypothetical protein
MLTVFQDSSAIATQRVVSRCVVRRLATAASVPPTCSALQEFVLKACAATRDVRDSVSRVAMQAVWVFVRPRREPLWEHVRRARILVPPAVVHATDRTVQNARFLQRHVHVPQLRVQAALQFLKRFATEQDPVRRHVARNAIRLCAAQRAVLVPASVVQIARRALPVRMAVVFPPFHRGVRVRQVQRVQRASA